MVIGSLVPIIIFLAIVVWAVLVFKTRKNARPVVLPDSEKLATFRSAYQRFGQHISDARLLKIHANVLPKFDNAYVAATFVWLETIRALLRPGTSEVYSRSEGKAVVPAKYPNVLPPSVLSGDELKDLGLVTICEFVLEGHLSPEEGRRFFDQIIECANGALLEYRELTKNIPSFDAFLEKKCGLKN